MAVEIAPGRPGNLTPEQEEKLRKLWELVFRVCAVHFDAEEAETPAAAPVPGSAPAPTSPSQDKKKGRLHMFSRKGKKDDTEAESTPAPSGPPPAVVLSQSHEDDKYGQAKDFHDTLATQSPESIRATIWGMVKHDHPDALLLRFLRARKWDVEKALVMLVSTMNWRAQEMKVDEVIMRSGDEGAAIAEKDSSNPAAQRLGHDFLAQARMGKSYIHGTDKVGRPICYVRVRLHKQGEQIEESLERYTVYVIETCRHLLQPPIDTATVVFDMTGFSLANMDYTPVKFMIKCFEANYPESLGAVLVHKAPWVFQGIWRVIKGWLDPVVANKVHFTNNVREMEAFISAKQIPKELDGEEDWTYRFVEPVPGENAVMADTATRDRLVAEHAAIVREFEAATARWIAHPGDADVKARRAALTDKIREAYWRADPYLRARSLYDRTGVLLPGGKIQFYPGKEQVSEKAVGELTSGVANVGISEKVPAKAPEPVNTSPDDLD
ncbi:phosphatidylinositol transfer protein CSR1 [Podospora conica]|nr:phosphatidylinositol transfer protein CSR1 [Schizothecium conicum]